MMGVMEYTSAQEGPDAAPHEAVAALAFAQHGVVGWRQLRQLGYSEAKICGLAAGGRLLRVHRGVYAVGHARLSARGRWAAAVLACGDEAYLSHRDAAALHDLQQIGSGAVHVTAAKAHSLPGVTCHTTRDPARLGGTTIDGIPVTSLERTILDLSTMVSDERLCGLLEELERRGLFDVHRLETEMRGGVGHHGIGRLRRALRQVSSTPPTTRSGLERDFLTLVRAAGLPEPSVNVVVVDELVDFHWPRQRVIVEVDSWRYHRSRRSFEDDRRRTNRFGLAGQLALRITDLRIANEPDAVVHELQAALAQHTREG
jgi:very-short-patch-repair endonuclease